MMGSEVLVTFYQFVKRCHVASPLKWSHILFFKGVLLSLPLLEARSSQARAAPDRDERSVRAAHAARPDLVKIQRAGWCLPPAAQCVILQSGQTSSGPGVLVPEERSASVSSR